MFARVPASSANLGPGFDALAVALNLYVEVSVDAADEFEITTSGVGAGLYDDESHLAARIVADVLGTTHFQLHVHSEIPLSRGLGSSAALALAAAAAAGANDPLTIATAADGHAENAAASMIGGLVVASVNESDGVLARSLELDPAWRFVIVLPEMQLATADARRVLPAEVPFTDAVANLSSLGLLVAGLAHHGDFVPLAMSDRLHQPYRMALVPFAQSLLATLREAGAAGSCWSGAGSAMLGLATEATAPSVASAAREFMDRESVAATVVILEADRTGLVTR